MHQLHIYYLVIFTCNYTLLEVFFFLFFFFGGGTWVSNFWRSWTWPFNLSGALMPKAKHYAICTTPSSALLEAWTICDCTNILFLGRVVQRIYIYIYIYISRKLQYHWEWKYFIFILLHRNILFLEMKNYIPQTTRYLCIIELT